MTPWWSRRPSEPPEAILVACLDASAPPDAAIRIGRALGLSDDAIPRTRTFGKALVTVRLPRGEDRTSERLAQLSWLQRNYQLGPGERLYRRWPHQNGAKLQIGSVTVGESLAIIAGPCSVESESMLVDTAQAVAAAGAHALRGGVFKPRTSPYAFGGLGPAGLPILRRAREQSGLPVVSEVLEPSQLDAMADTVDVLQLGSRNMHVAPLLFAAGAHASGRTVLLKRGFGATVDELLHAAEYVLLGRLAAGHTGPALLLCERGIRSFEQSSRFSFDPAVIAAIHGASHLPVLVDPSHAAGRRELVRPLARAAVAAGADGLLIEVHPRPECAFSDGAHAIEPDELGELVAELPPLRPSRQRP